MGSRAVIIVCRMRTALDVGSVSSRMRVGICYTRTGRRFFDDLALGHGAPRTGFEPPPIERVSGTSSHTDWMCLDCELMPWSAKAQELLRNQYAAVGAASRAALANAVASLRTAAARGAEVGSLLARTRERAELADKYVEAYRRYCWPVHRPMICESLRFICSRLRAAFTSDRRTPGTWTCSRS